jgi:hypothetical protein
MMGAGEDNKIKAGNQYFHCSEATACVSKTFSPTTSGMGWLLPPNPRQQPVFVSGGKPVINKLADADLFCLHDRWTDHDRCRDGCALNLNNDVLYISQSGAMEDCDNCISVLRLYFARRSGIAPGENLQNPRRRLQVGGTGYHSADGQSGN